MKGHKQRQLRKVHFTEASGTKFSKTVHFYPPSEWFSATSMKHHTRSPSTEPSGLDIAPNAPTDGKLSPAL